jgi:LPS export ABC transporter permease LptG/LPS export ABC transporter permease LptF
MPRIFRYVLTETLGPTFLGLFVYTVLFVINLLFQLADLAIRKQLSPLLLGQVLALALPGMLTLTVPMSILLGVLVGMGRMSADGEIVALRSCGVSYVRILRPLLVLGLCGWLVSAVTTLVVVPEATYAQHRLNAEILLSGDLNRNIQPGVFFEEIPGVLLYAGGVDESGLRDVLLVQRSPDGSEQITLAAWARLDQDRVAGTLTLRLHQGETHEVVPGAPELYQRSFFEDQAVVRPPETALLEFAATLRGDLPRNAREMRLPDLWRRIQLPPGEPGSFTPHLRVRAQIELHRRLAIPLAALLFSLLGPPLGIVTRRGGRSAGFAVSLGVILAYWLLLSAGENLARSEVVSARLAVWLPNLALAVLGPALLIWLGRERPLPRFARRWPGAGRRRRRPAAPPRPAGARGFGRPRRAWSLPDRIDRYISGQFLRVLALVLASFTLVHVLSDLRTLLDDITAHAVPALVVARYFGFASPGMIVNGLPLAGLLAGLLAFGALERNREITALKAAGVSVHRLTVPVLVIGLLLSVAQFAFSDSALPGANRRAATLRAEIRDAQAASLFGPRRWAFGEGRRLYNLTSYSRQRDEFQGLTLYRLHPRRPALVERTEAACARYEGGVWVLRDGWRRAFEADGERFERFAERRVRLPETPEQFRREAPAADQMSYLRLQEHIRTLRRSGYDVQELQVALHEKVSMAAVPAVLILLGLTFAFRGGGRPRGNLAGIGLAVGVAIAYYVCLASFRALGEAGIVPALLAAWSPAILFTGVAAWRMLALPS